MIGKIYKARTPYYNLIEHKMSYKARPALIIGKADYNDYVVLPISSISIKTNINPIYDIKLDPQIYPKLNLDKISYVRTHKQTIIHKANLHCQIADIKLNYNELYIKILNMRDNFNNYITKNAY